jgi:hypothetical protein
MEKLNLFFAKIKEISFWQRIFSWKGIRLLSYDAYEEFKNLENRLNEQKAKAESSGNAITKLQTEKEGLEKQIQFNEKQALKLENQIEILSNKIEDSNEKHRELNRKLSMYESLDEQRLNEYEKKIAQLNQVKQDLDKQRQKIQEEKIKEKEEHFATMKKMWHIHEADVEQTIKMICQKYAINYIENVPFRGNPDNALEICGEYIIFDAKSPANDDLNNFPKYLKLQTDSVKKYANQEDVKKEIFLVVPSNTIQIIPKSAYNMADYNVYIITKDALEPIILSLKKIEEYEFADKLSPEERDNICRVIGKFSHTTKRKIQIDQFFNNQFIELLIRCKNDLPNDILRTVVEFEKAEKLNPPSEKRAKQILTKDLHEKNKAINTEAEMRGIEIPNNFVEVKNPEE